MKIDVSVTGVGDTIDRQKVARLRAAIERRRQDARRLWGLRTASLAAVRPRALDEGDGGERGGR